MDFQVLTFNKRKVGIEWKLKLAIKNVDITATRYKQAYFNVTSMCIWMSFILKIVNSSRK